jgi:hypothetical protein
MNNFGITWPYVLRKGHSNNPAEGACAMDAINWLVHGKHGDTPECSCPIIAAYVITGNDKMPNDVRQRLIDYLPRISGSRSKEHETIRTDILWRAAVRIFAPITLEAENLPEEANKLRNLSDNITPNDASAAAYAAEYAGSTAAYAAASTAAYAAASAAASAAAYAVSAASYAAGSAAAYAASTAAYAASADTWEPYFTVLDQVLKAGPEGQPWSAAQIEHGITMYKAAGGLTAPVHT